MATVGNIVLSKAFEALYAGLEELIGKNLMFKSLSVDIKSKLSSLKPLIQEMAQYNQQLSCPGNELEPLEGLMISGTELVGKCSTLRRWNVYKKYKYARKLLELNESLEKQLEVLKVQVARDVKKHSVMLREIGEGVSRIEIANQKAADSTTKAWCAVPELPQVTVGLDGPLQHLKVKLLDEDVSRLVLTAPGGCGKTTLATKFCQDEDVKDRFKDNILFATFSKKPNFVHIVKDLYRQKGYKAPSFYNEANAVKGLQEFMKEEEQNPLLLIIDDVWFGSGSLLDRFDVKMPEYKILVTSRSEIPSFGSSYQLQLLDDDIAMILFHHTASLGDKSSHIPVEISKKIVKRCNGFPLAITVTGRSLCGQPIEMWQSRIIEWSKGSSILDSETELLLRLQSSLDGLGKEMSIMKKCYQDLGSFPEDNDISVSALIDMWAELYDLDEDALCIAKLYEISNRSLANLVYDRCLIDKSMPFHISCALVHSPSLNRKQIFHLLTKFSQICRRLTIEGDGDYSQYIVKQHDLLRELAIYNSKQGPMRRRERMIIEICGNDIPKWWREQMHQPLKARLISISTDGEFSSEWPNMELPEAEVLVLHFQTNNYSLPDFIEKMGDKLKVVIIKSYGFTICNFQLLGSLSNLKRLRLQSISLSSFTKTPVQLKSLRKLTLHHCTHFSEGFVHISDIFSTLVELSIDNCVMEELPAELGDLIHLTRFSINACASLSVLPETIGNLISLEVLRIRNCVVLLDLPESIENLSKLHFLDVHACIKMMKVPSNIGELMSLRQLNFTAFLLITALPEGIGNLVNLEVLRLRWCTDLLKLPDSIRNLKKLEFLDIHNCVKMQELPEHIGEAKSLRKLDMSRCMKLSKLPPSVMDLQQLEEVICEECDAKQLWPPFLATLSNIRLVIYDWQLYESSQSLG